MEIRDGVQQVGTEKTFQVQASSDISQTPPTSGTKYEICHLTGARYRIIGIMAKVTWTVQPTPLEVHITIDGITIRHYMNNPTSGNNYHCLFWTMNDWTDQGMGTAAWELPYLYEGNDIKIEAETTGGTVSELRARVKYCKAV